MSQHSSIGAMSKPVTASVKYRLRRTGAMNAERVEKKLNNKVRFSVFQGSLREETRQIATAGELKRKIQRDGLMTQIIPFEKNDIEELEQFFTEEKMVKSDALIDKMHDKVRHRREQQKLREFCAGDNTFIRELNQAQETVYSQKGLAQNISDMDRTQD